MMTFILRSRFRKTLKNTL